MNEILEEFKIILNLDDKPLNDGIKRSTASVKSLGIAFASMFATIASTTAIKNLVEDFAHFTTSLSNNVQLLGVSAGEVQALGNALQRFGGSTDTAISSLESLNNNLIQARYGQGALIEVAKRYGISFNPFASATNTLKSLSQQMGRFTVQQRKVIGNQLGLSDDIIRSFSDGGKTLNAYIQKQKELGVTTKEDEKLSRDFTNAQLDLKDMFAAVTRDLARVILPAFTRLIELFTDFIDFARKHKVLIISFFAAIGVAMAPILVSLTAMAVRSAIAFAPFIAAGALFVGIALVVEDIYYYFKGWNSVTGDLVKKYPQLGVFLQYMKRIVLDIVNLFKDLINMVLHPSWKGLLGIFKDIGKILYDVVIKPFDEFFDMIFRQFAKLKGILNELNPFADDSNAGINPNQWFGDNEGTTAPSNLSGVESLKKYKNAPTPKNVKPLVFPSSLDRKSGLMIPSLIIKSAPSIPSAVSNTATTNNMNVNNNFNQNITTATPKQFADDTNSHIINSINATRQKVGSR